MNQKAHAQHESVSQAAHLWRGLRARADALGGNRVVGRAALLLVLVAAAYMLGQVQGRAQLNAVQSGYQQQLEGAQAALQQRETALQDTRAALQGAQDEAQRLQGELERTQSALQAAQVATQQIRARLVSVAARSALLQARVALDRALLELDRRNFGLTDDYLQQASKALGAVSATDAGVDAADLDSLQKALLGTEVSVALDLEGQRSQLLQHVKEMDTLLAQNGGEPAPSFGE
jgi:chromosome segregation ATPase